MDLAKAKKQNYFIELIRFIFSVIIVYYHLLNNNIMSSVGESSVYQQLAADCKWASLIVEFFLIISGYFLYSSMKKSANKPFLEVFLNRFFRLWPLLAVYTVVVVAVWGMNKQTGVFHLSLLHATGLSLEERGIVWYIPPFFWSGLLIMAILRKFDKKTAGLILSVIAYLGFSLNLNQVGGFGRQVVFNFISLAMVRCLEGIALGVVIAMALEQWKSHYIPKKDSKLYNGICFTLLSAAEILSLGLIIKMLVLGKEPWTNVFVSIVFFTVFFIIAINNAGLLSKTLNLPVFNKLGRYSYSIYVTHQISFYFLRDTLWKNEGFINSNPFIVCSVSILFCIFLGAVGYHLIEKPCMSLYYKWKKEHTDL